MIMNSFVALHRIQQRSRDQMNEAWTEAIAAQAPTAINTFSPNVVKDSQEFLKIALDVLSLGFSLAVSPIVKAGKYP
jgi:hypothetical protein